MAKRNIYNTKNNINNDNNKPSDTSSDMLDASENINNGNINKNTDNNIEQSTVKNNIIQNDIEKPIFEILKYNIISNDKYVYLIELAKGYNLFNNINLMELNKSDLLCLLGFCIDKLYAKENELTQNQNNNKKVDIIKPPNSDIDNISYTDLLNTLNIYKSWN